jgi:hypothetical protein
MTALPRSLAFGCWIVLAAACGNETAGPDDMNPLVTADLALVAADGAAEDLDLMREPVFFSALPGFAPGHGDFRPVNCPFDSGTGRLICPVITHGGVTIERSYAFWDAADAVQQTFDPLTTARANVRTALEGTRTLPDWDATVARERDMTATGLEGTETVRTWNGSGSSQLTRSRHTDGAERSYDLACTLLVEDVVVPVPGGTALWPLSGTITRQCTVTFVGGRRDGQTVSRTAVITFNGTGSATLAVDGRLFDLDLALRRPVPRP